MSWNDFLPQLAVEHEVLESLFLQIGTPQAEKEAQCQALFEKFMACMHEHIRQAEQDKARLTLECQQMMDNIRRMTSLVGQTEEGVEKLTETLEGMTLWDRHRLISEEYGYILEHYKQKLERIQDLHRELSSFVPILGTSYVQPGPYPEEGARVTFDVEQQFSDNIEACQKEQIKRKELVETAIVTIRHLWTKLGYEPQDAFDRDVISADREEYPISEDTLRRLNSKQSMLEAERSKREELVKEHLAEIMKLWDRLQIGEDHREQFTTSHIGLSMETIRGHKSELSRLEEIKAERLEELIMIEREKLHHLWEKMLYSFDQRQKFNWIFNDEFTFENLTAHEQEVARLEQEIQENAPLLDIIGRYRKLLDDIREFELSTQDANRFFDRDPGRLLREERERKRHTRQLPKIQHELEQALQEWQDVHGRPFLAFGEKYINTMKQHAQEAREGKENEKAWREHRRKVALEHDLRYGSQNPKSIKNTPNSPHTRRIAPFDQENNLLPQTPSKRSAQYMPATHPGTPTKSSTFLSPSTPTRAASAAAQPVSSPIHSRTGGGPSFYSRSESPAMFRHTKPPGTPTKGVSSRYHGGLSSSSSSLDYNSRRSNSIISISSVTTDSYVEPRTPTRHRTGLSLTNELIMPHIVEDEHERTRDVVHDTSLRHLKRPAAALSSPTTLSPPDLPTAALYSQRRRSRSHSPVRVTKHRHVSTLSSPFIVDPQEQSAEINRGNNSFVQKLLSSQSEASLRNQQPLQQPSRQRTQDRQQQHQHQQQRHSIMTLDTDIEEVDEEEGNESSVIEIERSEMTRLLASAEDHSKAGSSSNSSTNPKTMVTTKGSKSTQKNIIVDLWEEHESMKDGDAASEDDGWETETEEIPKLKRASEACVRSK
ncbi:hypothetical protein BGZ94_001604 [Podila epigama]|nr:hypothetical protein BGZ94_001604 [Podila epigama]